MSNDIKVNEYNGRFFTNSEMEEVLTKRGMEIDVENVFNKYNFAYLIYNFSSPFYYTKLKYERGTKISEIIDLYKFNRKASILLFDKIHEIELLFKKNIVSSIENKDPFNYLKKSNYEFNSDDETFEDFFYKLKRIHKYHLLEDAKVLKGKLKNGISPIWIFVDKLSLGQLIKFIRYFKNISPNKIYMKMGIKTNDMLNINRFRNQIAHMNPLKEKNKV